MAKNHTIRLGECVSSVAYEHGFFPLTVWDHPANAALKRLRGNPDVLEPGDVLVIPDMRAREVEAETGKRHSFRRKGIPEKLTLRLLDPDDKPRAGEAYTLRIDDAIVRRGELDKDGWLFQWIPPNARRAVLSLRDGEEEYELQLSQLQPIETIAGLQARLDNLGHACGAVDGVLGPRTRAALRAFQEESGLPATGEPDDATRAALEAKHGC